MTAYHGPGLARSANSSPDTRPKWERNPRYSAWWAARVARWPHLFPTRKKWRKPYLFRPESGENFQYATDEELARIMLEERFGPNASGATTPDTLQARAR